MAGYVTDSGLVVTDRRHIRAAGPRELTSGGEPPRDNPPNDNPVPDPPVSVGPNASEGFGNTHVMYPSGSLVPQAWSGWPVEWATPRWGSTVGLAEIFERMSTVWFCIDLNSSILSTMPPYRMRGSEMIEAPPWMTNPQPEAYTGWVEAFKQVVISFAGGEAFLWATSRYEDRSVRTWVMLNPSWVQVDWVGGRRYFSLGGAHLGIEGPGCDVLHIRYASWPGDTRGHGPLEAAAANLFGAAALERYAANLAVRGGIPWAVLSTKANLSTKQATDAREQFVAARISALGAPAVLSGGFELKELTLSPKDMALLELQQFHASRLALLLWTPPFLAGLPSGGDPLTYNTAEGIYDFHWRAFLKPKAVALCDAISQWALPRGQRMEVNRDEYVQPPFNERTTGYSTLFNIVDPETGERAMTIPEIRARERFTGAAQTSTAIELTGLAG